LLTKQKKPFHFERVFIKMEGLSRKWDDHLVTIGLRPLLILDPENSTERDKFAVLINNTRPFSGPGLKRRIK
jgi:hypothetical protein